MGAVAILKYFRLCATIINIKAKGGDCLKYKIPELSARAMMRYAELKSDGVFEFRLNEDRTNKCISFSAPQVQDDSALFFQTTCVLHGDDFKMPVGEIVTDLSDIIIYINFSGIFDRVSTQKKYADRRLQAESMFRPEGVKLDFGKGSYRYIAFERSASMSRNSRLSFIREDFYEPVKNRIMLGMQIGMCQLSKLYAYNGLMLTSGFRISDMSIWNDKHIVVVDNPISKVVNANIITVEDDGSDNPMRKYRRVEKTTDLEITEFDGEGLISNELAEKIDTEFCGKHVHSSFQIRMPYIKGVVHQVDFKSLFAELGVPYIIDMWGVKHQINDVDLILTKSMFKGYGWMRENNLSFSEYIARCKQYRHSLYISGVNQVDTEKHTELNYQFLNTVSMKADEFRPTDLPLGWQHSPEQDNRHWITKNTEAEYYKLSADADYRNQYFLNSLDKFGSSKDEILLAKILKRNPLFINEPIYAKKLLNIAQNIIKKYAIGRLIISGDNRYLSGDLMRFVQMLIKTTGEYTSVVNMLETECYNGAIAYAPSKLYPTNDKYTLLRNPHIAKNEEAVVTPPQNTGPRREKYLSHLSYVIMIDSRTLIPERLGGADFDGDMIKTIADPLLNECVARNYYANNFSPYHHATGISLLKIPSAVPIICDANDWQARFETIKSTFANRVGLICNAAFDRSIAAYDENSDDDEREKLKAETEMLQILTGLEIDSVKSGIKPDLTEYLNNKAVSHSSFLKYKNIVNGDDNREWYEPTKKEKLDKYFDSIDWDSVTSNVERLPYLAKMLEENTPKIKAKAANDDELFAFAMSSHWKNHLSPVAMEYMKSLITDFETAITRIRRSRHVSYKKMARRSDIERILYARGQENDFTADELYAIYNNYNAKWISELRKTLTEEQWHLMSPNERESFLRITLPAGTPDEYFALLADFWHGGYRILGDILCDLDDAFAAEEAKSLCLHRKDDSGQLKAFMNFYEKTHNPADYKKIVADYCKQLLNLKVKTREFAELDIDLNLFLQCAIALGKRKFAFEVLLDVVERNVMERSDYNAK